MFTESDIYLGEILINNKLISREQLDKALEEQKKAGGFIGEIIVNLGFADEKEVFELISKKINIPYIRIKETKIEESITKSVPARYAYHYSVIPVSKKGKTLTVAMSDPLDVAVRDDLELLLGFSIEPALSRKKDILEEISRYYGVGAETLERMIDQSAPKQKESTHTQHGSEEIRDVSIDASISRLVNQILLEAHEKRATDIHIEPYEGEVKIRYRIDGVLYQAPVPEELKYFNQSIISRIKIMASLNIAEKRLPQDGKIKVKIGGEDLNLRVSILPTPFGESVNIRLLNTDIRLGLKNLGFADKDLTMLENIIKKPHGIILVTGPTGSGKTTTLYSCLDKINQVDRKIITIEDPIEYQLKGITQIQIHPQIDLSFARGLRSMLRHDPDVMMVGEIRDYETAEIAIRVALTGHLVFSTLHTNDSAGAITRLLDMGVEPYLIASSVECIVAQRLVRVLCPHCKSKEIPKQEALGELGIKTTQNIHIFENKSCSKCRFTGFLGRTAIYEILSLNEEIRGLILNRRASSDIKKAALKTGMKTMRENGWDKIRKGITTISEVLRVTQEEGDLEYK
ncbi:MAG: ATPase, T2SS/T4P/T4SS family [bacterium]